MMDADLESNNSKAVSLNLMYRGVCESSKAYLLAIEPLFPPTMRPRGICFDGSDSLFKTHQDLVKRAGHAVWFSEFTPARPDHLGFVNRLLQTLCELDIFVHLSTLTRPILQVPSVCIRRAVLG